MNVLVHTRHAEHFNRLLGEAGASHLRLIQVSELNPAVMLQLNQRLENGEWLAIAGDRVPLHGGRNVQVDFLGHPVPDELRRAPVNELWSWAISAWSIEQVPKVRGIFPGSEIV